MMTKHLAHALERAAQINYERTALRGEGATITYGQWLEQAKAVAQYLKNAAIETDETVMVRSSNHPADFIALLGVWLAGAVAVPVHRTSPSGVIDSIQAKARCRFELDMLADSAPAACLMRRDIASELSPEQSASSRSTLEDAALVIFTSGSTGLPKGVVLTHSAFSGKLEQNQKLLQMGTNDVTLLVLNNTFSFGIWMALLTLLHGGTVVTLSRFTPQTFLQSLTNDGITRAGVVPTMIRATFGSLSHCDLSAAADRIRRTARLKDVVIGGEPLGKELSAKLRAFISPAQLTDIYGLTETSTCDFILTPTDYPNHPGSIGQVAPNVKSRIVNDMGKVCPPGVSGELQLLTPYIMSGYLGDEALTQAAFEGEWFRTGDLAAQDDQGFVTIVGRLKELIVRGGNKITPLEIERALCNCTGVAAALVTGVPDEVLGQRIHALLVAEAGAALDAAALRMELLTSLEKYKQPDMCYVGTELPTGRTGKIDRGQLKALLQSNIVPTLASWAN